jgi:cytoskeletal protein RodZ
MCNATRRVILVLMGRVVLWIVVVLVVYAIITNPTQAAGTTSNLASGVASVGEQIITFFNSTAASLADGTTSNGSTSSSSGSTSATCPEGTSLKRVIFTDGEQGMACVFS